MIDLHGGGVHGRRAGEDGRASAVTARDPRPCKVRFHSSAGVATARHGGVPGGLLGCPDGRADRPARHRSRARGTRRLTRAPPSLPLAPPAFPGRIAAVSCSMVFEVIPAIDVSEGRLAMFTPDGPRPGGGVRGDPVAAAEAAVAAGARWLHVVDMDLAFRGEVREPRRRGGDRVAPRRRAGGRRCARRGRGPSLLRGRSHPGGARVGRPGGRAARDRAVVGGGNATGDRDRGGRRADPVARSRSRRPPAGWRPWGGWSPPAASSLLVTSVARVGGRGGPDVELVKRVLRAGRPVLAAGGSPRIEDLRRAPGGRRCGRGRGERARWTARSTFRRRSPEMT